MRTKNMENLIAEFNMLSSEVKEQLNKLLVVISDGRVPSNDEMDFVFAAIGSLQLKYDAIYQVAASNVALEELLEKGLSVVQYAKTVENSRLRVIKTQMENAKVLLERFIRVKSLIEAYAEALRPFQREAVELLAKIGDAEEREVETLFSEMTSTELFLQALDADINNDHGIQLMSDVNQYYPLQVQWGLASKAYYVDEKVTVLEYAPMSKIILEDNADEEADIQVATDGIDEAHDLVEGEPIDQISMDELPVTYTEQESNEVAAAGETAIDEESSEVDEPVTDDLIAINRVKMSTSSASSFKKEIINMSKTAHDVRVILPLMTNLGVLTKEQVYLFGVCMDCFNEDDKSKGSLENALDVLALKGFVAYYEYSEGDSTIRAYCLSGYCYGSMHKDSVASQMRGFWKISYGSYKFIGETRTNKKAVMNAVNCNSGLLKYFYASKIQLSEAEYQIVKASIKWHEDHYQIAVFYDRKQYSCYVINNSTEIGTIKDKNVLLVYDEIKCPDNFSSECEKVFVLKNGVIYQCDADSNVLKQIEEYKTGILDDSVELDESEQPITETTHFDVAEKAQKSVRLDTEMSFIQESGQENIVKGEAPVPVVTPQSLLNIKGTPSDDEFCSVVFSILGKNAATKDSLSSSIAQSVLLAKGAALISGYKKSKKLAIQLQLATDILFGEAAYTSENLASAFEYPEEDDQCLLLAAYLFAMLIPAAPYDYGLKNQTEVFFEQYEKIFAMLPAFKAFFNKLMGVQAVVAYGFSPSVISLLGSDAESEKFINELRRQARTNRSITAPKTRMKALPIMYGACFGNGSDLYDCMSIIAENKKEDLEYVEAILFEYCDSENGTYSLSEYKIENKINAAWDDANPKNKFKLEYDAHAQVLRQFRTRLTLMESWVEHISSLEKRALDLSKLKIIKAEILKLIQDIQKDTTWRRVTNSNVLSWMLQRIQNYLNGKNVVLDTFSELLSTGIISLTEEGLPDMDESLKSVRYYEPWRNVLRHIVSMKKSFADVKAEILNDDLGDESGLMDNLHQLSMIGQLLGDTSDDYHITEGQLKEAIASAEDRTVRFKEGLELAYTYNQINETEKENLAGIMSRFKKKFFELHDFACWRRFLEALEKRMEEYAAERKIHLRTTLDSRLAKDAGYPLLREAERLLEEDMNFAVTEEYINRFDSGETEIADELDTILHDFDYFSDFLSKEVFDPLLSECRRYNGSALKTFGWRYLEKKLPKEWTNRLREDSKTLISNWPSRKDTASPTQIQALFSCFGLDITRVTKVSGRKEEIFQLTIKPTARSMADYRHPISAFGTQVKSPINVIILYGNYTEKQLVDTVSSLDLRGISIVLIDRPLDASQRRLIGEIFRTQTSGQNPFLLVDQVLVLYLAMHQVTERLRAMLKCTLPYTTYQPFVRDGGSTADEMFCGRTQELATIIDPNGACIVYGGRQLGKTALLERAESRSSKPENNAYAVYTNIINCKSEANIVDKIIYSIDKKTDGAIVLAPCKTLNEFCKQIEKMFRSKKIASMLLLMDEADNFLSAIADDEYKPLQPLVDLKRETKNTFKFVIAGLHNVCRAKKATNKNGVFGQLGTPLCIKPLSPTDALQLLSRPLRYLGFQIDRYPHLETILTKTNYYPGILQFFGYMLVETLTGQYAKYYHAADGNPPFTLQDEQLGAVMNSSDLNRSIRDKFRWSLELDSRYFMIARCITMLYHYYEEDRSASSWLGYSVIDIMEMANEYNIRCLENESRADYINLLDEMVEMGILSQPKSGLYRLRKSSFVDIIGEDADVLEAEIINNNQEVEI